MAMRAAAYSLAVALVFLAASWLGWISLPVALAAGAAGVALGTAGGWLRARRAGGRIAYEVERRAPECRNLLVTAAELSGSPPTSPPAEGPTPAGPRQRIRPEIARLVESRAADLVEGLDPVRLFPLGGARAGLVLGLLAWAGLAPFASARDIPVGPVETAAPADLSPVIVTIDAVVTAPPYTGLEPERVSDPQQLRVIAGSRVSLRVRATADTMTLTTRAGTRELGRAPDGGFDAEAMVTEDGFMALEPRDAGGAPGPRRLIGWEVVPDAPPVVRITEPGRDLFFPTADRTVPLEFSAEDDFAVDELRLTYTIVSGSGETFEFVDGEVPARVTRTDERRWTATADLDLVELGLGLGDMVVYRAVARDRRPGAVDVESDAFVVEIVGDAAAIAGGFALESDEERDALSQRMIIIKTERLLERADTMPADELLYEARRLAAEQRTVRAEFVFMMGGEVQDEVEEAEHEHEIAEGRLELRGRRELSRSVLFMSQAAAQLTDVNLEAALPLEYEALEALQSALARSRYILRVLPERQSIDLARRLTGEAEPSTGPRTGELPDADPELDGLRRVLDELSAVAATGDLGQATGATLSGLANELLMLGTEATLLAMAAELDAAAGLVASGDEPAAQDRLAGVLSSLVARIELKTPEAPAPPAGDPELAGALIDALDEGRQ